jgi:hypothetical protein
VVVPTLPLNQLMTVTPQYNIEMKLTPTSDTATWALYRLTVRHHVSNLFANVIQATRPTYGVDPLATTWPGASVYLRGSSMRTASPLGPALAPRSEMMWVFAA